MTKTKQRALWRKVKNTVSTIWNVPGVESAFLALVSKLAIRAGISGAAVALIVEITKAVA